MSQFKIEGGSFGTGVGHFNGGNFSLPSGRLFKPTQISSSSIESAELASAESLKKLGGTLGWGAVGLVALGPLGMFAGLLAGGRKNVATFIVTFKDGRTMIGTADTKVWVAIKSAAVTAAARSSTDPTPPANRTTPNPIAAAQLNRNAKSVLSDSCKTWGWTFRRQSTSDFKRFDVITCSSANRTIALAITDDPVTAYLFGQMESMLSDFTEVEQRYLIAPSIGQSLMRDVRKSGICVLEPDKIAETVAGW